MRISAIIVFSWLLAVSGCGNGNTPSNVSAPGKNEEAKTRLLEAGAGILQTKSPLSGLNAYLNGFHFYSGDMSSQMEAHHYCGHLNEEVIQCVIFDGNADSAKIMGVEYIVSRAQYETLPGGEKALWHSHVHEVRSGQLIAPGIPDIAEQELMQKLAGTYGKTWHTWHTDREHRLPVGIPKLMMGFTEDGQSDVRMVASRDTRFRISSAEKRAQRKVLEYPPIDPGADAWKSGIVYQLQLEKLKAEDADPSHAHQ